MKLINKRKHFFILLFFILISSALIGKIVYPKPKGFANDFAGVISGSVIKQLDNIAIELKQKTDFGLAVAVVPDLQGEDPDRYATDLYAKWGVGSKKTDAGVLLLIAVKERKLKIETGYGAEGFLPDGLCGQIADNYIVPYLKKNDWNKGVLQGTLALASVAAKNYGVQLTGVPKEIPHREGSATGAIIKFIITLLVISLFMRGRIGFLPLLLLGGLGGRSGGWSGGGSGFGGFGGFGGGLSGGGGIGRSF